MHSARTAMTDDLSTEIKITASADGVEAGVGRAKRSIADLAQAAATAGEQGGKSMQKIGAGGEAAARTMDGVTKNMVSSLQRQIAALEAGGTATRQYQESIARMRGADLGALKPYLDQLDAAKAKAATAAHAQAGLETRLGSMGTVASVVSGQLMALTASLSMGAVAAFVLRINDGLDALNDVKDATGSSIESISALEEVALRSGTSLDVVTTSLVKLNDVLLKAKPGSAAEQALQAIGLEAEALRQLDPAEALRQVAVALSEYADDQNKARLVQELFGKSLREMAPFLADLAEKTTLVGKVTTEQAAAAERFNKQLFDLKTTASDAGRAMVTGMLPGLNQIATAMADGAREGGLLLGVYRGLAEFGSIALGTDALGTAMRDAQAAQTEMARLQNLMVGVQNVLERDPGNSGAQRRMESLRAQLEAVQKQALGATDAIKNAVGAASQPAAASKPAVNYDADAADAKKRKEQEAAAAAKQAAEALRRELSEQAKIMAELHGLSGSFADDWARLSRMYADGALSLDQLTQAQGDLLAKQPAIKAAADAEQNALEETAKARQMAAAARTQEADGIAAWFAQQEAAAAQSLQSVTDRVAALQAEEAAVTLATSLNISLAEAIERVAIERLREKQTGFAEGSEGWQDIEREIEARKKLLVMVSGKTQREDEARGWADMWQSVDRTAHDVFVNVLEGGQDAFERLGNTLKATVLDVLYQMTVRKWIINIGTSVFGAGFGAAANAATGGGAGGALSALGSIGSGYSLLSGIGGTFGGGLSAGFGGLMGSLGLSATGSTLGGAMSAGSIALQSGNIMGGLGTIAGALGPIALGIGLLTSFIKKPTPHSGAGVTYSAAGGLTSGASQYNKTNYGFGAAGEYSAESNTAVASVAKGIATALDSTAVAFGKKAGFEISTAFADDKSKDGAWGQLAIKLGGQTVLDWRDTQTSKWAPKEFSDGEAGLKEYQAAVAASMRDALSSLDLPGWVDSVLQDLGDAPALEDMEKALSSIALANDAMAALGSQIGGLSGLSDEATASLIEAFGGVESFAATASEYANVVLTDAEKVNLSMADISSQFEALGMSVPTSVAALQELIGAQDLTTDAGREAVASLMTLGTSFASVMDQMQQSIGLTGDSLKSVFQNVLKEANSAEEAKILGEQAAGQLLMDAISNALVGTVTDLVSNAVLQPITQSIVGAAAQAATMDVAAASAAGATLAAGGAASATTIAAGGAAGATSLAAGGAAGGANVAAGGAAAGQGLAEIVGKAISVTNAMVDIMNNADFQTAFGNAVSAIGSISGTLFGGMTSIQTSMPGFAGGGSAAISSGGGGGGSSATDNKNPLDDLLEERRQLEIELLKAQGQEQEALNRIRAKAIEGMSAEAVALYDANRALEEQIRVQLALNDFAKESQQLNAELLSLQGNSAAAKDILRELAIDGMTAVEIAAYDANEALREQINTLQERQGLEERLADLIGNSAYMRERERAAISAANLALYDQVIAIEDAQTAAQDALNALKKAAQAEQERLRKQYEAESKTLQDSISSISDVVRDLDSALKSVRDTLDESTIQSQTAARLTLQSVLTAVQGGSGIASFADVIKQSAGTLAKNDPQLYAQRDQYIKSQAQAAGLLGSLNEFGEGQLDTAERQLKTLEDWRDSELDRLDEMVTAAEQQYNAVMGIKDVTLSINDAVQGFDDAIAALGVVMQGAIAGSKPGTGGNYGTIGNGGSLVVGDEVYAPGKGPNGGSGNDALHNDRAAQEYLEWIQTPGAREYEAWVNPVLAYTAQPAVQVADNSEVVAELRAVRLELSDMKAETRRTADAVNGRPEQPMLVENVA